MEFFRKARVVRLRSHHDKYLLADEDEEAVIQDRDGSCVNAKWTVEFVEHAAVIRLKSCYGKYLTASNLPFMIKFSGKKVLQTTPPRLDSSVEWEPIREGVQVRLRTRYGQYLRANGGLPPWRNSITHDIPHRTATKDWVLWDVDVVETLKKSPLPSMMHTIPTINMKDDEDSVSGSPEGISLSKMSTLERDDAFDGAAAKVEGRVIYYEVADEEGNIDETRGEQSFLFNGMGVDELTMKLEEVTGLLNASVCSRNPLNGKLYPLRLHLPPNNIAMNVVVVPSDHKTASDDSP